MQPILKEERSTFMFIFQILFFQNFNLLLKDNYAATWWVLIQRFTLLFHDILNLNNMLYKFRVRVSTLCHFCMKILKTSIHLFHICTKGCSPKVRKGCSPHLINHLSYTKECHLWTWWSLEQIINWYTT